MNPFVVVWDCTWLMMLSLVVVLVSVLMMIWLGWSSESSLMLLVDGCCDWQNPCMTTYTCPHTCILNCPFPWYCIPIWHLPQHRRKLTTYNIRTNNIRACNATLLLCFHFMIILYEEILLILLQSDFPIVSSQEKMGTINCNFCLKMKVNILVWNVFFNYD